MIRLKTYRSGCNITALIVATCALLAVGVMVFAAGWFVFWVASLF